MKHLFSVLFAMLLLATEAFSQESFDTHFCKAVECYAAKEYTLAITALEAAKKAPDATKAQIAKANKFISQCKSPSKNLSGISFSKDMVDLDGMGQADSVLVKSGKSWEVTASPEWADVKSDAGLIRVSVDANGIEEARMGVVEVTAAKGGTAYLFVNQKKRTPFEGSVHIRTIPERALIYMDKDSGALSEVFYLEEGRHAIRIEKKGYERIDTTVFIGPEIAEGLTEYVFRLTPTFATISVIINAEDGEFESSPILDISGNNISKFDLIMLDILANYDWKRPIYFVSRGETKLGLEPWLQFDGFVYKLVPFLNDYSDREATLDADALYEKLMHTYRLESLADTNVHWDYQNVFTFTAVVPVRDIFATTATALLERGEKEKAEEVLDKCIAIMPAESFPYNVSLFRCLNEWSLMTVIEDYFRLGKPEKALAVGDRLAEETLQSLIYYSTPIGPGDDDILSKKLADDAATIYLYLVKIYNNFGQKEAAEALESKLKDA